MNRDGGYLIIARRIRTSAVWDLPHAQFKVFMNLLMEARWDKTPRQTLLGQVTEGQTVLSVRRLAAISNVSKKVVELTLKRLQEIEVIRVHPRGQVGCLITFLNYSKYQDPKTYMGDTRGDTSGDTLGDTSGDDPKQESKKATTTKPRRKRRASADESLVALRQQLLDAFLSAKGFAYDWRPTDWGDLRGIRGSGVPDDQLAAAWGAFLADKFFPSKNMSSFRRAFSKYAKAKPVIQPATQVPVYDERTATAVGSPGRKLVAAPDEDGAEKLHARAADPDWD